MDTRIYAWPLITLIVLYVLYGLLTSHWNIRALWRGEDGRPSTSKFQFVLWFVVILAAYVAVVAARIVIIGTLDGAPALDPSLLLALGFSGTTAVVAKQVTTNAIKASGAPQSPPAPNQPLDGGLATADNGNPDLGKIELLAWTLVAVAIFLITVVQRIAAGGPSIDLPPIDPTLVGLTGIGQATYLGQKIASAVLPGAAPAPAPAQGQPAMATVPAGPQGPADPGALQMPKDLGQ